MYSKNSKTKSFRSIKSSFESDLKLVFLFKKEQIILDLNNEKFILIPFSYINDLCFKDNKIYISLKFFPYTFKSEIKSRITIFNFKLKELINSDFPSYFFLEINKKSIYKKVNQIFLNYLDSNFSFKIVPFVNSENSATFINYSIYFDSYFNNKNEIIDNRQNNLLKRKYVNDQVEKNSFFSHVLYNYDKLICNSPFEIDKYFGAHKKFCCKEVIFLDKTLLTSSFYCDKCKCNLFFSFCLNQILPVKFYNHKDGTCKIVNF